MTPVDDLAAETPAYPGYATPTFTRRDLLADWLVRVAPGAHAMGTVAAVAACWSAWDMRGHYVGLFPDKQAAGEALVRAAGYEVL